MAYIKFYFASLVLTVLLLDVFAATLNRPQRSISENQGANKDIDNDTEICQNTTPCGWAVYKPFERKILFFMKNRCVCHPEKECIQTDDDLSVSAYVYRCQSKKPQS